MRSLAAAMFAAFAATVAFVVPLLAKIEESINVVVVADAVNLTRTTFVVAVAHACCSAFHSSFSSAVCDRTLG